MIFFFLIWEELDSWADIVSRVFLRWVADNFTCYPCRLEPSVSYTCAWAITRYLTGINGPALLRQDSCTGPTDYFQDATCSGLQLWRGQSWGAFNRMQSAACRWRLTKNVGSQGRAERKQLIPHVVTPTSSGVLTLTSNDWLGFGEGAEQCIMPMKSMSVKVCVRLCGLVPDSEGLGQKRRVLERDSQVWESEKVDRSKTQLLLCIWAKIPECKCQRCEWNQPQCKTWVAAEGNARVPAADGLVRVGRPFFRPSLWRCLSVHPPRFYFAPRLNCTRSHGPLLRCRSPTSAPLG